MFVATTRLHGTDQQRVIPWRTLVTTHHVLVPEDAL
jgi:hypothetical protein